MSALLWFSRFQLRTGPSYWLDIGQYVNYIIIWEVWRMTAVHYTCTQCETLIYWDCNQLKLLFLVMEKLNTDLIDTRHARVLPTESTSATWAAVAQQNEWKIGGGRRSDWTSTPDQCYHNSIAWDPNRSYCVLNADHRMSSSSVALAQLSSRNFFLVLNV